MIVLRVGDIVGVVIVWSSPLMHEDYLAGDFFLKTEVGSFFIPSSDGGRDGVHGLDAMHNPGQDSS